MGPRPLPGASGPATAATPRAQRRAIVQTATSLAASRRLRRRRAAWPGHLGRGRRPRGLRRLPRGARSGGHRAPPAPPVAAPGPHPPGFAEAGAHGRAAMARGDATVVCGACHGADLAGGSVGVGCADCHLAWPHPAGFKPRCMGRPGRPIRPAQAAMGAGRRGSAGGVSCDPLPQGLATPRRLAWRAYLRGRSGGRPPACAVTTRPPPAPCRQAAPPPATGWRHDPAALRPGRAAVGRGPAADAAWMATGVESRPDLTGRPQLRMEQQLGTHLRLNERWTLDGQGALRDPAAPDAPLTGDLLALSATRQGPQSTLRAGRQVRVDPRGALHLDGVSLEWPRDDLALALWSGRLWHPETWRPGSTWVGGLGLDHRLAPGRDLSLGAEARLAPQGAQTRVFGAYGLRGARGQAGRALGRACIGSESWQPPAAGGGSAPVAVQPGRRSALGGPARRPAACGPAQPHGLAGPQGYGAAAVRGSRRLGPWRLSAEGGPTLHRQQPGVETGGIGRLAVGLNGGRGPDLGLALVGARRGRRPWWARWSSRAWAEKALV